ncbi:hypothetical protein OE88DRAFT_1740299 [Heliocybe sulcata]|uniref:DUF6532 domain-containing protein n=1 Tax=Heliocybe sulcata TaxID=5364 RepID=A0A5C3MJN3_9AGAM|nr:hypothetical protein OE88DRAFT_1740299 [Heliocybe sulcata]
MAELVALLNGVIIKVNALEKENAVGMQDAARRQKIVEQHELDAWKARKAEQLHQRKVTGNIDPGDGSDTDIPANPIPSNAFTTKAVIQPLKQALAHRDSNIPPIPSTRLDRSQFTDGRADTPLDDDDQEENARGTGHRSSNRLDHPSMYMSRKCVRSLSPGSADDHSSEVRPSPAQGRFQEEEDETGVQDAELDCSIDEHEDSTVREDSSVAPNARRGCKRPKVSNYDDDVRDVIEEGIRHFRCLLVSENPFPASRRLDVSKMAAESWAKACEALKMDIPLDGDICKLKRLMLLLEIMARDAHVRGELKSKARPLVETLYNFETGIRPSTIQRNRKRAEVLLDDYNYTYRHRSSEGRKGAFQHKIIQKLVNAMWFKDPDDEGIRYGMYFGEISHECLALMFTAIECCIEEWETGKKHRIDFTTQKYKERYEDILQMLYNFKKEGGKEILGDIRRALAENGRFHSGVDMRTEGRRGPMSGDAIAAAIQDYHEHGGLYEGSSEEEEEDIES